MGKIRLYIGIPVDAIGKSWKSPNRWIKDAIEEKLKRDGFLSE